MIWVDDAESDFIHMGICGHLFPRKQATVGETKLP